jgi:sec-independent protein translocase protein TatA
MFGSIGMPELVIVLVIALIIFGPRKLPDLGRSLGRSIGEFKKASSELQRTLEDEIRVEERKEKRAAEKVEQDTAIEAGTLPPVPTAPVATAEPTPATDTVNRTNTGTPA